MRVRHAERGHPRVDGGAETRGAVLDRHTLRRGDAKMLRRQAVARGIGLAARRELGGDEDLWNRQAGRSQMAQRRLEAR